VVNDIIRRFEMPNLNHLGIGGLVFVIGAIVYVINLALALGKRPGIPVDGVGLMVLGIGLALLLRM
jgi:predicted membrane channel-forming protein YqfA (hemolysin III family)